ncbi:hypothetical protein [Hyphomonas atlantica corrig.]|uniref:hypothetical protein n=1 Tax=Hyphomonas atlantica TaxID=1280948 RepID=UPI0023526A52|nr:hypothetical protein [Hyphomonas atlantica]
MIGWVQVLCKVVVCYGVAMSIALSTTAQVENTKILPLKIALPLAAETTDGAGCKTSEALTDKNARTYARHLSERFNTEAVLCLTTSLEEATSLAEHGEVNMVWVDQSSATPILSSWRASLTLRSRTGLGRPPFVLFGKANAIHLGDLNTNKIGFLDRAPQNLNIDLASRLLSDFGFANETIDQAARFDSIEAIFTAVENGSLDAAIVEAGSWGRACAVLEADSTICDGFEVLIYDRPRAENAFMIPSETDMERHYRLVGVHIALHLDHPEVFEWLSQGKGQEFDPTEATAMLPKSADLAIAF